MIYFFSVFFSLHTRGLSFFFFSFLFFPSFFLLDPRTHTLFFSFFPSFLFYSLPFQRFSPEHSTTLLLLFLFLLALQSRTFHRQLCFFFFFFFCFPLSTSKRTKEFFFLSPFLSRIFFSFVPSTVSRTKLTQLIQLQNVSLSAWIGKIG